MPEIFLQCQKVRSKLRMRIVSRGYNQTLNCSTPTKIREQDQYYRATKITLIESGLRQAFYKVLASDITKISKEEFEEKIKQQEEEEATNIFKERVISDLNRCSMWVASTAWLFDRLRENTFDFNSLTFERYSRNVIPLTEALRVWNSVISHHRTTINNASWNATVKEELNEMLDVSAQTHVEISVICRRYLEFIGPFAENAESRQIFGGINSVPTFNHKHIKLNRSDSSVFEHDDCVICLNEPVTHGIKDCGHYLACKECIVCIGSCPLCRTKIKEIFSFE